VGEWRFEVSAEHPAYIWNRVISYVNHGHSALQTREHGALTLEAGRPEAPEADGYRFFAGYSIMGRTADDRIVRVVNWDIEPMSAHRLAVHVKTFVDDAEPYVVAMLNTLGYRARMVEVSAPYCPERPRELRLWRARWRLIRDRVARAESAASIAAWLDSAEEGTERFELRCSPDTIAGVMRAGEAGLLD